MPAGVLVPSFACRPNLWCSWPRALPPALAAADLPPVKAGKPTHDPKHLSSEGIRFWRTFGNALSATSCALRRLTAPSHPRSSARPFQGARPARARSAATPPGPPLLVRSPDDASSDLCRLPTPATNTTRGRTHASRRSSPVRDVTAFAAHPPRLPRCPASCEVGVPPASRFWRSARRGSEPRPPCGVRGSGGPSRRIRVIARSPSSFLLPSTRLSSTHRHSGLDCPRRVCADRRPPFPRRPAKGAAFPKTEGAFHRTSAVIDRGPLRGCPGGAG